MENKTKGAGDDYPVIPQTLDYKCADCGADMNEGEAATFTVCDKCWETHYKSLRSDHKTPIQKELASLKEENAKLKAIEEKMSPGLLQFIADMFDNLNRVSQMQRPFMWNVALVCTGDNKVLDNLVNVWAGVGEANPIKRIEQLLNQRDILRQFIVKLNESHTLTDEEKANLTLLMKCTDPS